MVLNADEIGVGNTPLSLVTWEAGRLAGWGGELGPLQAIMAGGEWAAEQTVLEELVRFCF